MVPQRVDTLEVEGSKHFESELDRLIVVVLSSRRTVSVQSDLVWCSGLRERVAAEDDCDEVEDSFCSRSQRQLRLSHRYGMRLTLDFGQKWWDVPSQVLQSGVQCRTESKREHEIEELVHVLRERLSDRLR